MFLRFVRFNVVGAMGIAVQLAALTLLVSGLGVHYLPATALAIELSVLHNFFWHERWTWGDRTGSAKCKVQSAECKMQNADCAVHSEQCRVQRVLSPTHAGSRWPLRTGVSTVFARLVMFHAGNGLVSMAGSLVLMPVFVGWLGHHYIVANLSTIAATGVFNFLLGDRIVFRAVGFGRRAAARTAVLR